MPRDRGAGALIAALGGIPWLPVAAGALAERGLLSDLVTPLSPALARRSRRAGRRLARRSLPETVPPERISHAATSTELAYLALRRLPLPDAVATRLATARARRFDSAAAGRVRPDQIAAIAHAGAALATLRRARAGGVAAVVDSALAHYRFVLRLMSEEARLQPEYATTLQGTRIDPSFLARVDEELELADRVIVVSRLQWQTYAEEGVDERKLVHIPLGVDEQLFRPRPREPHDRTFRVLFVGQLTQRKGLSYALEGFERAGIPESELMLVGAPVGTARPWRGRARVRHVPHMPRDQLPSAYGGADVYVLPSLAEGLPQTALEAMASGLPVVVSENALGPDVIRDGVEGYVVPIRDSYAIAERLRALHGDPDLRARMGAAARAKAERFTWRAYGRRIVDLVQSLA